ncbi:MAG: type III pantothenate kinase, partial [Planctomycetota bacterium]
MLIVNIGNSTTAFAVWAEGAYRARFSLATHSLAPEPLAAWLESLPAPRPDRAAIGSVVPGATERLSGILKAKGFQEVLVLNPARHPIRPHELETPETTGGDRLTAARAAWEREQRAVLVIDAGTAVTVDAVDREGVFLGGAILPGPVIWLAALHNTTAQRPPLEMPLEEPPAQG